MKKFAVFCFISLISSAAFAAGDSAFASLVTRAGSVDIQVPAPSAAAPAEDIRAGIQLTDITDKCAVNGEVVSAFPAAFARIPKEENILVTRVYRFTARDGAERKVEIVITGGDWMQYPLIYIVSNAGASAKAAAYFVPELSTPDRENGEVAPEVDFHDQAALVQFITGRFLDRNGAPQAAYPAK